MVLGDGARDRGALADQISPLPCTGPGSGTCGWRHPPTRYGSGAAYVSDADIMAMANVVGYLPGGGL